MEGIILATSFGAALIDWIAVQKAWKTVEYVAKPGMMVLLLAWVYSITGFQGQAVWFALGLFFSLIGDVFLMLSKRWFLFGLVSFLTAHIFYIIGFIYPRLPLSLTAVGFAIIIAVAAQQVYTHTSVGLTGENRRLRLPVIAYTVVISIMLLFALLTLVRPEWRLTAALFAALGALLFYISDAILAYNRFVRPTRFGRLANMVCYHLGQLAIAISAVLQFSNFQV